MNNGENLIIDNKSYYNEKHSTNKLLKDCVNNKDNSLQQESDHLKTNKSVDIEKFKLHEDINTKCLNQYENHYLNYNILYISSQEEKYEINYIKINTNNNAISGWESSRFCSYPQELILKFDKDVCIKQINLLSHEYKISSNIDVYYGQLSQNNSNYNYTPQYEYIGHTNLINNVNNNNKSIMRELKKIYLNENRFCQYVKLVFSSNHENCLNVFNQIGIISLQFYGTYSEQEHNNDLKECQLINKNKNKKNINNNFIENYNNIFYKNNTKSNIDNVLDKYVNMDYNHFNNFNYVNNNNLLNNINDVAILKISKIKQKINESVNNNDFNQAIILKNLLDEINIISHRIKELDIQKKMFIINDDFDGAKNIKNQIDELKKTLTSIDNRYNSENKYTTNNNFNDSSKINSNKSLSNLKNNDISINKSKDNINIINNKIKSNNTIVSLKLNQTDKNEDNDSNKHKEFKNNNFVENKENSAYQIEKEVEYDDIVIPALRNKQRSFEEALKDENESNLNKGELEDLDKNTTDMFNNFITNKFISEKEARMLFSKQILYREEGLDTLNNKLNNLFDNSLDKNILKSNVNLSFKLLIQQLNEKHPQIVIKSIDIFIKMLIKIQEIKYKPNESDTSLTDTLLSKIKNKIGESNRKIRKKAVELYSFLLKQDLCEYNNLIIELIDDELNLNSNISIIKNKNMFTKSSQVVLGKLEILETVFDQFTIAIDKNKTSLSRFPFDSVLNYIVKNLSNPKSEVRNLARIVCLQMYNTFGFKKMEKILKNKVELKDLEKLAIKNYNALAFNSLFDYDNNSNSFKNLNNNNYNITYSIPELKSYIEDEKRNEILLKKGLITNNSSANNNNYNNATKYSKSRNASARSKDRQSSYSRSKNNTRYNVNSKSKSKSRSNSANKFK